MSGIVRKRLLLSPAIIDKLVRLGSLVASFFGVIALIGWGFNFSFLTTLGHHYIPMAPSTALFFLVFGFSLYRLQSVQSALKYPRFLGGVVWIFTIAALVLFVVSILGISPAFEHLGMDINQKFQAVPVGHMSPLTAFCFLLSGVTLISLMRAKRSQTTYTKVALISGILVLAITLILLIGYVVGGPFLYGSTTIPPALSTTWAFVALGFGLVGITTSGLFGRGNLEEVEKPTPQFWIIAVGVSVVIVVIISAHFYFRNFKNSLVEEAAKDLQSIAELKVDQLEHWRQEQMDIAAVLAQDDFFAQLVSSYFAGTTSEQDSRRLQGLLTQLKQAYHYQKVSLLDTNGVCAFSISPGTVDSISQDVSRTTLQNKNARILDFYRGADQGIYLTILIPLYQATPQQRKLGLVAIQINPDYFLYPLIQNWPAPRKTAETVLIRQEQDSILILNNLRFDHNAALQLRMPVTRIDFSALNTVRGKTRIAQGVDYRGEPVLTALTGVPDSPWYLIAKIDLSEIYAPHSAHYYVLIGFVIALLAAFGGISGSVWQRKSKTHYRELYNTIKSKERTEERLRTTLQSIGDAVIATNVDGNIELMNAVAEKLTGWQVDESYGRPVDEVFQIVNEETGERISNAVERVLQSGTLIGLTNHTLLSTKNGEEIPIAESAAPILDKNGEIDGVVLVFRDQSEERRKKQQIERSEKQLQNLFDHMNSGFALHELITDDENHPIDYRFLKMNNTFTELVGIDEKAIGQLVTTVIPGIENDPVNWIGRYGQVVQTGKPVRFEAYAEPLGKWFLVSAYSPEPNKFATIFEDITAQKEAEKDLKFQTEMLAAVGEGILAVDLEGRMIYSNKGVEDILGFSGEELLGKSVFDFVPAESTRSEIQQSIGAILSGEQATRELQLQKKDGSDVIVLTTGAPVFNDEGMLVAVIGVLRDISEWKQAEVALEMRAKMLNEVGEAVITTDQEGRIIYWNIAAEHMYGWSRDEVLGHPVNEITVSDEMQSQSAEIMEQLLSGNQWTGEFRVQRKDGSSFLAHVTNAPMFDEHGSLVAIIGVSRDISESKKAEQALRQSEERFRKMFEEAPLGIAMVTELTSILNVNRALVKMLGYEEDELLDKSWSTFVHPEDRELDIQLSRQLFDGKMRRYEMEKRYLTKQNEVIWADANITVLQTDKGDPYRLIMIKDITESKQLEQRYSGLFNGIRDAILIANTSREIVDCNPAFTELFGYSLIEIQGKKTQDIYANPGQFEEVGQQLIEDPNNPHFQVITEYKKKSGDTFPGETALYYLKDENGEVVGYIGVIRDVTARDLMERELIESQKMEALGQIAGGIAHDFNNVLSSVIGASQMLELKVTDDAVKKYVDIIKSSVDRGIGVTQRMLTFTRSSKPEVKSVALGSFLTEFKELARHTLPQQIYLHLTEVSNDKKVFADPAQLQQVLFTLAINAADAMPEGGNLSFNVRQPTGEERNKFLNKSDNPYWCLVVTDDGLGMDETTQKRIFEPFFTTKESSEGTGLGLAVTEKIIRMHSGWIDVTSAPGQGTTFIVGLPGSAEAELEAVPKESIPAGHGENLLIVDDEPAIREMLAETFSVSGYTADTAGTGQEALDILQKKSDDVDLIITDVGLPDMNGRQLIMQVLARYPDIPIIALTGYVDARVNESLMSVGANMVFQKPYDIQKLSQLIRRLLNVKHD